MPKLFKKLRSRRSNANLFKKTIFRKGKETSKVNQSKPTAPVIEPSITWTSEDTTSETQGSPKELLLGSLLPSSTLENDDEEPELMFSENEVNYMGLLKEKDEEIAEYKNKNSELQDKFDIVLKELGEKIEELTAKEIELEKTQTQLKDTSASLREVSSALIQTQHKLFEQQEGWTGIWSSSWLPSFQATMAPENNVAKTENNYSLELREELN